MHHKALSQAGCPNFFEKNKSMSHAQAFCWCGLDAFASMSHPSPNYANVSLLPSFADAVEEENPAVLEEGTNAIAEGNETDNMGLRYLLNKRAAAVASLVKAGTPDKACHNKKDGRKLQHRGKKKTQDVVKACAKQCTTTEGCTVKAGTTCFHAHIDVGHKCSTCFGMFIHCSDENCLEECACESSGYRSGKGGGGKSACDQCNDMHCKKQFNHCSGLKGHDTSFLFGAEMDLAPSSIDEGEVSLIV